MKEDTIGSYAVYYSCKYRNNLALIDDIGLKQYTYADIGELINSYAKGLLYLGIKPGDKVAIASHVSMEYLVMSLAVFRVGAILVSIDPSFKERELRYTLELSEAKVLFVSPSVNITNLKFNTIELNKYNTDFKYYIMQGSHINTQILDILTDTVEPDDVATIKFTSGTTGNPKAVLMSHRSIIGGVNASRKSYNYTSIDRILLALPMFYVMGCELTAYLTLSIGATLVITGAFKTSVVLEAIEKYKCTAFHGVPTMYHFLMSKCSGYDLSSLKTGMMGGSVTSEDERILIKRALGLESLINVYGQTEVLSVIQTDLNTSEKEQLSTSGRPIDGVEIKILDDNGNEQPAMEQGEVVIKTPYCMIGYYKNEVETAKTIRNGLVFTGDLGYKDFKGNVVINGRSKDIIIRGGENISPTEIESILKTHPLIDNAGVIGVPDKILGEEVGAFIVCSKELDIDDLKSYCGQYMAKHKIPKYIYSIDKIPMTESGKIQKFKLKEMLVKSQRSDLYDEH